MSKVDQLFSADIIGSKFVTLLKSHTTLTVSLTFGLFMNN